MTTCLWRAPPPNFYRLKSVLGYRNHDFTKKKAPAWSFVRYVPPPRPKPVVSVSPFQKMLFRKNRSKKTKKIATGKLNIGGMYNADDSPFKITGFHKKKKIGSKRKINGANGTAGADNQDKIPSKKALLKEVKTPNTDRDPLDNGKPGNYCELCCPMAKKGSAKTKLSNPKREKSPTKKDSPDDPLVFLPASSLGFCQPHHFKRILLPLPGDNRPAEYYSPLPVVPQSLKN
ncbi:Hypothetical protein NTJ_09184 [Nesidiocoris tenuis]|uniref:Uncharacterized protein n=1 Tax=Nesidiocoris tenuis TaxID=355587 RepID=A0ABN7AW25_9HEMI|nr:Hypothetical protein NTJ_09184 [Nesidiocoris tenuis]